MTMPFKHIEPLYIYTPDERSNTCKIKCSRQKRIATGSGTRHSGDKSIA